MCQNDRGESFSNSDGKKITKDEFDKAIENAHLGGVTIPEDSLHEKIMELEKKLKKSNEAFDYITELLVEVLKSLKPKLS